MSVYSLGNVGEAGVNRALINVLCSQRSGVNICHINAHSLYPKIDEIRRIFIGSGMDIILVSETWLRTEITDNVLHVPGYRIFRCDRLGRRGGGVAIFIKSSLNSRMVFSSNNSQSDEEYIFCEIFVDNTKLLVGVVYKPPNCNTLDALSNDLICIASQYQNFIVGGDFNLNFLRPNGLTNSFQITLDALDLHRVNQSPTFFTNHSSSLLDVFITADPSKVLFFQQLSLPGISDHDMIMITYDLQFSRRNESGTFSYYDYNRVDLDALQSDANNIEWESIYYMASVDEQVDFLYNALGYLHERHVPLITRTVRNPHCPWLSSHIQRLMAVRDVAYAKWKRFRLQMFYDEYRVLRNRTVSAVRSAKKRYYESILNTKLPSHVLWKNLKKAGVKSSSSNTCTIDPDLLNGQFSSHMTTSNTPVLNNFETNNATSLFSFSHISASEILAIINSIKSNSRGIDDINPKFIKLCLPFVVSPLAHICNTCFTMSTFPKAWKLSKIIPVPKHRGANCMEFRPISILPFFSKVIEKCMHLQVAHYLNSNDYLNSCQSGFRSGHSCTTALLGISNDISKAIDKNELTVLVFLDFSKAFDTVDHGLLCSKLISKFNFSNQAMKLISNYLTNRFQAVYSNDILSTFLPVTSGVPQGSILGPLLFSIFINDMFSAVEHSRLHLYADDAQLYLSRPIGLVEDGIFCINSDLEAIYQWSNRNKLGLNPQKSKCLLISRMELNTDGYSPVILDGTVLPFSDSVKSLGVIFNKTFTWNEHIGYTVGRINGGLRALWANSFLFPVSTRLFLARSLLVPIITYGCEIYCKLDASNARKLTIAFNCIVRYIYSLRRFDHVSLYVSSVLGCDILTYLNFRSLCLLIKIIKTRCPEYLFKILQFARSGRACYFIVPRCNYLITQRLFFAHIVKLWNGLPQSIRNSVHSSTLNSLKCKVFKSLASPVSF